MTTDKPPAASDLERRVAELERIVKELQEGNGDDSKK